MKAITMLSLAVLISAAMAHQTFCRFFDMYNDTDETVRVVVGLRKDCRSPVFILKPHERYQVNVGPCRLKEVSVNESVLLRKKPAIEVPNNFGLKIIKTGNLFKVVENQ